MDEIEQRQPRRLVLLRDRHDEPEVGLHERALGGLTLAGGATQLALACCCELAPTGIELDARLVARLDGLGKSNLVVLGQEGVLTDVGEVEANEVFLVPLNALLGQCEPFVPCVGGGRRPASEPT